jgi:biopolymer transport protein ExbB/TolQ
MKILFYAGIVLLAIVVLFILTVLICYILEKYRLWREKKITESLQGAWNSLEHIKKQCGEVDEHFKEDNKRIFKEAKATLKEYKKEERRKKRQ